MSAEFKCRLAELPKSGKKFGRSKILKKTWESLLLAYPGLQALALPITKG